MRRTEKMMKDGRLATRHLAGVDPVMRQLIREVGPCTFEPRRRRAPFESLARAIAYQQLHDRAAESILRRFLRLFPNRKFPRPDELLAMQTAAIRKAGFSKPKIAALRDLAAKTLDGTVPSNRVIRMLDDHEIIERLIEIRGVGRWTVEMLQIFNLGRPDILPVDDYGVRNGYRLAYGCPTIPTPKQMSQYGERWKPYRTVAAWYLWRAADRAKQGVAVL